MNMKTFPNDVSNQEILQELIKLSVETKADLKNLKGELGNISSKIDGLHAEAMEAVHALADHLDERFDRLEGQVVTKGQLLTAFGQ